VIGLRTVNSTEDLRRALRDILQVPRGIELRDDLPRQWDAICALPGHRIEKLADPPPKGENYNCVLYALGFETPAAVRKWVTLFGRNEGLRFVDWLVATGKLEPLPEAIAGAIIAYANETGVRHVGLVTGPDQVVSKWGNGFLMRHGKEEVELPYGREFWYYRRPDPATVWTWAETYRAAYPERFESR
jgi:hypothetical protein